MITLILSTDPPLVAYLLGQQIKHTGVRARTRTLLINSQVCYPLHHSSIYRRTSSQQDLNLQPSAYKTDALAIELREHLQFISKGGGI